MTKIASGQPMRSAERLLGVLKSFNESRSAQTVREIADALALAPSTVRRLLQTLETHGFVRLDPGSGRYSLHFELVRLAALARTGNDLIRESAPVLESLREGSQETAQLLVRDGSEVVLLDARNTTHLFSVSRTPGHRYPAFNGSAPGKVLLAWLEPDELDPMLRRARRSGLPKGGDAAAFGRELQKVRRNGYAINDGETTPEVWAVAAPVRDRLARVVAAVNLPCLQARVPRAGRPEIVRLVVAAADTLSRRLQSLG